MTFPELLSEMLTAESENDVKALIRTMSPIEKNSFISGCIEFLSEEQKIDFICERIMDLKNNNVHPEGWEEGRLPNKLNMMSFKGKGNK